MDPQHLALLGITFVAAIVNGALGYGFSSITVPLALLFLTNRVLNPALVPIEVALNAYVLWVNRESLPNVWRRVFPIVIGLLPGVVIGHGDRVAGESRVAEVLDLPRAAAADPPAGGRLSPSAQVGAIDRSGIRRWRRGPLFRDDDLRAAAGGDAEQSGPDQARLPRGARLHPAGRNRPLRPVAYAWAGLYSVESLAWCRTSCRASPSACRSARR